MSSRELIDNLISAATVKESHRTWHGETQNGRYKLAEARKALEDYIAQVEAIARRNIYLAAMEINPDLKLEIDESL